jgi:hypothetical protein
MKFIFFLFLFFSFFSTALAANSSSFSGIYDLKYDELNDNRNMQLTINQKGKSVTLSFEGAVNIPPAEPDGDGSGTITSPDTLTFHLTDSFDNKMSGKIYREKTGTLKIEFNPADHIEESRCLPLYDKATLISKKTSTTVTEYISACSIGNLELENTTAMKVFATNKDKKVYFLNKADECPVSGNCSWKSKSYLIDGDIALVLKSKSLPNFYCVGFRSKKGKIIGGWIPIANLKAFSN